MPVDRSLYPADWECVSHWVRFERAEGRCEALRTDGTRCGAPHRAYVCRAHSDLEQYVSPEAAGEDFDDEYRRAVRIVLTTAHLCNCSPLCADPAHLAALCQLHHLRLDVDQHRQNAARTRRAKLAMDDLFSGENHAHHS